MTNYGNPTMRRIARRSAKGEMAVEVAPATYKGVAGKSAFLILLTIVVAIVTELLMWYAVTGALNGTIAADSLTRGITIGLIVAGVMGVMMFVGSFVIMFNASAAKFVGPVYCLLQGAFLGAIAFLLNLWMPGIAFAALLGTGIVFAISLFAYKVLGARVGNRFALGLIIGVLSFVVVEIVCLPIVYFIAASNGDLMLILGVQAGVALFCVVFATLTVFMDIQNIDCMVQAGADKKYEWLMAFSLTTGLVYLYMQILELLVRIVAIVAMSGRRE